VLCALALTASGYAEEMQGTISKVGKEGREITVKSKKSGKEKTVKISGSGTTLEGVKSRADLKEGQSVSVEHDGDAAKKVKVTK
jgi:hypothetical protein